MMEGWISIHRKLLGWQYYRNSEAVHLFVHILLKANHSDQHFEGVLIRRGQLMTGRIALSRDTGMSEGKIRTLMRKFKKAGILTTKATNKYSIVTICNYDIYQYSNHQSDQQTDQQATSKRPQTIMYNNVQKKNKAASPFSFDEVFSFFKQNNQPIELAEKFVNTYESGFDTKGNPINDWKLKAKQWFEKNYVPPSRKSINARELI